MNKNINWPKTKRKIEKQLKQYYYYYLSLCSEHTMKQDKDFDLKILQDSDLNKKYITINVDEKDKRLNFINAIRYAYNKLNEGERKIIYWTYFDHDNNYDDGYIANSLGFSLGYYYIIKKETLIRLSYALGIEVLDDEK